MNTLQKYHDISGNLRCFAIQHKTYICLNSNIKTRLASNNISNLIWNIIYTMIKPHQIALRSAHNYSWTLHCKYHHNCTRVLLGDDLLLIDLFAWNRHLVYWSFCNAPLSESGKEHQSKYSSFIIHYNLRPTKLMNGLLVSTHLITSSYNSVDRPTRSDISYKFIHKLYQNLLFQVSANLSKAINHQRSFHRSRLFHSPYWEK